MTDYSAQISAIKQARSLGEIREVARQFSASASGEGGVLYSRRIGAVSSEMVALEIAEKTGLPIINGTPRAEFLSNTMLGGKLHDQRSEFCRVRALAWRRPRS